MSPDTRPELVASLLRAAMTALRLPVRSWPHYPSYSERSSAPPAAARTPSTCLSPTRRVAVCPADTEPCGAGKTMLAQRRLSHCCLVKRFAHGGRLRNLLSDVARLAAPPQQRRPRPLVTSVCSRSLSFERPAADAANVGARRQSRRCKLPVEVGGRDAAVHKEVAASDEAAVGTHQERGDGRDLVGCTGTPCWALLQHPLVALTPGPRQLVNGKRRDDDAWADGIDPGSALGPANSLGHGRGR